MGGFVSQKVEKGSDFVDIGFVDFLVPLEKGDFLLIISNPICELVVFAVLSFNDRLNVVEKSLGRLSRLQISSCCLVFTEFGEIHGDLVDGGLDGGHEVGGNVMSSSRGGSVRKVNFVTICGDGRKGKGSRLSLFAFGGSSGQLGGSWDDGWHCDVTSVGGVEDGDGA